MQTYKGVNFSCTIKSLFHVSDIATMKTKLEQPIKLISQPIPLNWLVLLSKRKFLLPFYHTISDERLPHICNLYEVKDSKCFIKEIDFLCKNFDPISINELCSIVYNGEKLKKPVFHLTFDDGLKEVYTIIAPILEKKGIPATFFINTGFVDNTNLFYRYKVSLIIEKIKSSNKLDDFKDIYKIKEFDSLDKHLIINKLLHLSHSDEDKIDQIGNSLKIDFNNYLQASQPYLTSEEIITLANKGFTIGSHSVNHPHFNKLSIEEQKTQITQSFLYLDNLGVANNHYFSFPFSDEGIQAQFFNWLHGEEPKCKLTFGTSGLKDDFVRFHVHRVPMEDSKLKVEQLVKSEYFYFLLKSILGKNRISRK